MAGTLPPKVSGLIDSALLWHSSVCIAEIATGLGHYDPAARNWAWPS